jgi:cytochrome oxidase assembly protein ShyY1
MKAPFAFRLATAEDFVRITAWRSLHESQMRARNVHARFGLRSPTTLDNRVWLVAALETSGPALAAISWRDDARKNIREADDLYRAPSRSALRAGLALVEWLLRDSDERGLDVIGDTDVANNEYIAALSHFGFHATYLGFVRRAVVRAKAGSNVEQ